MTLIADTLDSPAPPRRAPDTSLSGWARWREGLFGSLGNTLLTLLVLAVLAWVVPPLVRWAVIDAVWSGPAEACAARSGACWAFLAEKTRFILFGLYPAAAQGAPALASLLLGALLVASGLPRLWGRNLLVAWILVPLLAVLVMAGVFSGLRVGTDQWGGLPLTLLLTTVAMGGAFPLAVVLALARRSRFRLFRLMAVCVIEGVRGVPLITVLYGAILLVPLMLPAGTAIDKLLRAQGAILLFTASYLAEIIRAGLQAIPPGQYEAARSLGLGYGLTMRLVVLPQALRLVIPSIVTLAIGILQDTTLVAVIGIHDLLSASKLAATDPDWLGFYTEGFCLVATLYFALCFAASRYSLWLERYLARGQGY
ncbi:amino acid ABC transporter permease [Rhodospirillum rubrum]|uniref:Amino acid ABC transporter, permease protein, 3-TM region, His/Glu/Gln/Arg/opine n=1 Tax=Rhodospirillum rubrum (strain ATCC 11170 / ATH 1.1.1 / DSM 467 / LMG 4362 / NCIMB 8255 / S1) TaxID=269796 RepID=Q2RWB0_RHORT|nr:amino acid ABC transporter permease [Rhodospirillum rubrum]ABC21585.1 Amino acid ABC transporter, permease protein, 3-TM region, His/Glu/Gln/Arg/opine [Rhodospirillum rubrum ATCC 11170]AEO47271.1 amino acid ABC transporter permease [Rhodospirillum rubrum F11]MBK5955803.1 amino acid ABC transporter permease [Rhodospirillum rubrum]QXG81255.1 amino acid ABC transporter permease [Rhodospirillum rubrum]HAP99938.1 amino acid ABC transporter permease [Rhodospirillum rubrum]